MNLKFNPFTFLLSALPFISHAQVDDSGKMLIDSIEFYKAKKQERKVFNFCLQLKEKRQKDKEENQVDFARALNYLGETYRRLGKPDSAEYWLEKGLDMLKNSLGEENAEFATSINNLGILYLTRMKFAEADSCLQSGLKIRIKNVGEESPFVGTSYHNLGQLQFKMGNINDAESYFLKALNIRRKALGENHLDVAATYNNLGNLSREAGNYVKAEMYALKSIEIRKIIYSPTHEEVGYGYGNLGNIFLESGDYAKSEKYYLLAIDICSKALGPEHPELADLYANAASLYYRKGDFSKSENGYLKALDIMQKNSEPDAETMSAIYTNLGNLSVDMGNPKKGEFYNLKALEIGESQLGKNHPTVCSIYGNLGIIYSNLGQIEKSNQYHNLSIQGALSSLGSEHPDLGGSYLCLGVNYQELGQIKQSEIETRKALKIWTKAFGEVHPKLADAWTNLGYLNEIKGNLTEAEYYYQKALAMQKMTMGSTHPDVATSNMSLGILNMKKGLLSKAEPFYSSNISNCLNQIENYFPGLSSLEKEKLVEKLSFDFQNFAAFALKRYSTKPSISGSLYNQLLATKGLLMNSSQKFKNRLQNTKDSVLKTKFQAWEMLTNDISSIFSSTDSSDQADLKKMILEAEKVEKELSRQSEDFKKLGNLKAFSWTDIRKKLKPGEAAIEMIRLLKFGVKKQFMDSSDTRLPSYSIKGLTDTIWYAALIVKPNSIHPEIVLLKNGNSLEEKWIRFYKNTIQQNLQDQTSYNEFWKKIDSKLGVDVKRVYFSPDGVFNSININTLYNTKTKKYLLEERDIRQVTNTKEIIAFGDRQETATNYACLLGNPQFNATGSGKTIIQQMDEKDAEILYDSKPLRGEIFADLPGTKIEVESIASILQLKGWKIEQLMEDNALEGRVKSTQHPKVLHFATHGFFQTDITFDHNPMFNSGLLLAGANQSLSGEKVENTEDGILTAYEAMNLNLDNTDLVVLSACETGLGEIKNGEGVYGLQRAFKVAGAKTIIMSLWKVDDAATQELMVGFYKHWLNDAVSAGLQTAKRKAVSPPLAEPTTNSKRSAFLKAQKELKAKYPNPYYWGAFVMVGE